MVPTHGDFSVESATGNGLSGFEGPPVLRSFSEWAATRKQHGVGSMQQRLLLKFYKCQTRGYDLVMTPGG